MITTELPVTLILPPPIVPRSPGQHVSGIIRCLAVDMGILKPEWAEELSLVDARDITDPVAVLRINIGLAWEEHYIPMLGDVADHPEEIHYEGIYMSPDGESVSVIITRGQPKHVLMVHEVKATYKSTKTVGEPTTDNPWMWMAQIKSYCKALGTRFAVLHVLFLCGDYSYPIKPVLKKWQLEFTQQELDDNWALLMDYREHRLSIEAAKKDELLVVNWEDLKEL